MILDGTGPADVLHTYAGKWFPFGYTLLAGMVFLVIAGIMIAPMAHRILHCMQMENGSQKDTGGQG